MVAQRTVAQGEGDGIAAALGFENEAAAAEAMKIIKKIGAAPRRAAKAGARRR